MLAWIIEHQFVKDEEGKPLVWSNSEGWTDSDDYETFTDEEKHFYNLPIAGKWTRIAFVKNEN